MGQNGLEWARESEWKLQKREKQGSNQFWRKLKKEKRKSWEMEKWRNGIEN